MWTFRFADFTWFSIWFSVFGFRQKYKLVFKFFPVCLWSERQLSASTELQQPRNANIIERNAWQTKCHRNNFSLVKYRRNPLQCGGLRSISLWIIASNVPHAPATEEAQGPGLCRVFLNYEMILTSRLPSFMVALHNTPRYSRESDGVLGWRKIPVGPAFHHVTQTFGLSLFWLVTQNFCFQLTWSDLWSSPWSGPWFNSWSGPWSDLVRSRFCRRRQQHAPTVMRTLVDHKAQQNLFCFVLFFFFFSFPIILSGKEIYNGAFLHPAPAAHNWLDAKEVRYFKAIIKEWNSCQGLLVNVLNKKITTSEIYLLKGGKSLSAEMEIVFTKLFLSGRMK